MKDAHEFTDEDLTAFLDGEADGALSKAIEMALESDPTLETRFEALQVPMTELRSGFDRMLEHATEMPQLSAPVASHAATPRWIGWAAAAAVVMAFGLGAFGGYSIDKPAKPLTWMQAAASYQALYVPTTLAIASPDVGEAQAQLASVSQAVGRDLTKVHSIDGLDFKRAQVLGYNGKPLVQIAYVNDKGEPMALCVIKLAAPAEQKVTTQTMSGLAAASWKADGYAYLLIGGNDQNAVGEWAEAALANI
jgi:anti-sigma factor RsiW